MYQSIGLATGSSGSRVPQLRSERGVADAVSMHALEDLSGFGRWWLDRKTRKVELSPTAARYLGVSALQHQGFDSCFTHVAIDDVLSLVEQLTSGALPRHPKEFRVEGDASSGMRWLRVAHLPPDPEHPGVDSGIFADVTAVKQAALRARLGYELTEFLVGAHTLSHAITNVIALICGNLGWDWGAYWAAEPSADGSLQLVCKHFWHQQELDLESFASESAALSLAPGQGFVGSVWQSGKPGWVEDVVNDLRFSQRTGDRECKLWSGYVFPVTYLAPDGQTHSPGVLEFYSRLSRQPDAQLPLLSATIGACIAQLAQRLQQQAVILRLAQVDTLTGLANRHHFHDLVAQACNDAEKSGSTFALVFIDLDRFKPINDAYGHAAGNHVLHAFAQRLQTLAPSGAHLGRLGGDEFALLLPANRLSDAEEIVEKVLQCARVPFDYEGIALTVSASVGVSTYPQCGETCAALLQSADAAMYHIKYNGRNGSHFSSISSTHALAQLQTSIAQRLSMETDLYLAMENHELSLVYQPIFDISRSALDSLEALIRWRRADGSVVPPDRFIPIAEQSYLIVQIGKWVVGQACRDLAKLRTANNFSNLKVHVNMAASEFTNGDLPLELRGMVQALNLDPSSLSLELTEGMLMKRPDQVIPVMRALRRMGFGISLDDFGMGHSSLALLKTLPISSLKIDRSFVRDLPHQRNDRAIAKTIIDLGRQLELKVIAEGVETATQLEILRQSGCSLIQGYLLARPMTLDQVRDTYGSND